MKRLSNGLSVFRDHRFPADEPAKVHTLNLPFLSRGTMLLEIDNTLANLVVGYSERLLGMKYTVCFRTI
jgi:hypothetical protein